MVYYGACTPWRPEAATLPDMLAATLFDDVEDDGKEGGEDADNSDTGGEAGDDKDDKDDKRGEDGDDKDAKDDKSGEDGGIFSEFYDKGDKGGDDSNAKKIDAFGRELGGEEPIGFCMYACMSVCMYVCMRPEGRDAPEDFGNLASGLGSKGEADAAGRQPPADDGAEEGANGRSVVGGRRCRAAAAGGGPGARGRRRRRRSAGAGGEGEGEGDGGEGEGTGEGEGEG